MQDIHRKIKFWNKGAEQITGYRADEMVGLDCPESKLNHIDDVMRRIIVPAYGSFTAD